MTTSTGTNSRSERPGDAEFVAHSETRVPETAPKDSLRRSEPGSVRSRLHRASLDWRCGQDERDVEHFTLGQPRQLVTYMRSQNHRRSHEMFPDGPGAPRPSSFGRFRVVAR